MYRKDVFIRLVAENALSEKSDDNTPADGTDDILSDALDDPDAVSEGKPGGGLNEADAILSEEADDAFSDGLSEEAYADGGTEESKWTAGGIGTSLTWESVLYADAYQIDVTSEEETQPGTLEEVKREFRIHENPEGAAEKITVFWNDNGTWEEIKINEETGEYELYQHSVEGMYQRASDSEVPYETNLKARLRVEEILDEEGATGRFRYTLVLPDADSLTPKDGGNEIKNDEYNRLRFTRKVEIYSDLQENEESPESEAYVRSKAATMEYQIN